MREERERRRAQAAAQARREQREVRATVVFHVHPNRATALLRQDVRPAEAAQPRAQTAGPRRGRFFSVDEEVWASRGEPCGAICCASAVIRSPPFGLQEADTRWQQRDAQQRAAAAERQRAQEAAMRDRETARMEQERAARAAELERKRAEVERNILEEIQRKREALTIQLA